MIGAHIFFFIFIMWILIIAGGGILILLVAPITISGFGELDSFISSLIKAIIAIALIVAWIIILSKIKNRMFLKRITS